VFVLLTLIIGVYIVLDIGRPLRATLQVANSIARGDLTFTIPEVRRGDEFGMLNVSLRAMVDNLREILNSIGTTVTTLTAATSEIMTTTSELAVSSTQMATAVNEATTTVEEVKQTAQVSSQRAQQVAQSAQQAAQVSQAGRQATDETLEEMNRIKDQMNSIAESVVRLNEQTQAIGEIITSVNDLAEQSNLLAVNASIEAAKAGEQGRGFAVVAQEVRHLAEQSKESTAQVRGILSEIQKATGGAVMVAEQGTKAVDLGVRQSREAGESIKTLATRVVEAAQAAVQISASTHQQLVGMDQVVTAMVGIKDGSVQTAASMRHVQTSAQRLYEMTQNLKKLTERYSST
jgi:methyl-accepting chemotaxis protein